jgi:hypothetical protein
VGNHAAGFHAEYRDMYVWVIPSCSSQDTAALWNVDG